MGATLTNQVLSIAVIIALLVFALLGCLLSLFVSRRQSPRMASIWYMAPSDTHPAKIAKLGYYSAQHKRRVMYLVEKREKQG